MTKSETLKRLTYFAPWMGKEKEGRDGLRSDNGATRPKHRHQHNPTFKSRAGEMTPAEWRRYGRAYRRLVSQASA